jgi:Cu/Ag efflux protein CusF
MKLLHLVISAACALAGTAHAQATADHAAHHPAAAASADSAATTPTSDAEVRKIDKEQGKITLRHGPIANLDMPAMTMVFRISDLKLLDTVKAGDKIKFAADNLNGALTVTAIEVLK